MFKPKKIFKNRFSSHLKLLNRYLRYIFNGHFMIALMFMIITVAVYYQRWLQTIPDHFPYVILIGAIFSFVVLYNPLQTFLKEPDQAFLIVKEKEMGEYFIWTLIYNYVVQLYAVAIALAVVAPLYFQFHPDRDVLLNALIVLVLLTVKAWHIVLDWHFKQRDDQFFRRTEKLIRSLLTFLLFYCLITLNYFVVYGFIYIVYLNLLYFYAKRTTHLNWLRLIESDVERLALFYRFVSLFAQVPHVKSRTSKRRALTHLVNSMTPFAGGKTYTYLYRLTFLRSGEYFSLFLRLTVLAILVIIFVPNVWLKLVLALLFMYMTNFQMQSLYYHHRLNVWLNLYPLSIRDKESAYMRLAKEVSFVQTLILSIAFLSIGNIVFTLMMLVAGSIFNYSFHEFYIKRKIQQVG